MRAGSADRGPAKDEKKEEGEPESHTAIQADQSLLFGHKIMAVRSDYLIILNRYSSTRISALLTNIFRSPLKYWMTVTTGVHMWLRPLLTQSGNNPMILSLFI